MFAKLYEDEKIGQVLVKFDTSVEGSPEVRFFFSPDGLGVCSSAIGFKDTDSGWDTAKNIFNEITEEKAVSVASSSIAEIMAALD